MAKRHPQKQSLLQKALLEKKVLTQEVLMYQHLMEFMRNENSFEDILKALIHLITKGLGYDRAAIFIADWENNIGKRVIGIDRNGDFEWEDETKKYPLSPVKGTNWLSDLLHGHTKGAFTNNLKRILKKADYDENVEPGVICN